MTKKLFIQALIKFILGIIIVSTLIFIPAGTLKYYNGWLLIALLFIPMFIAGIILLLKKPELLKKRLNVKEQDQQQKKVVFYSAIMFILGFISAGLNYKYEWIKMPNIIIIISSILFIISYILYAEVLRENIYLSRTIEVQKNQKVIDKGLYGIVRHPMYSVTIILFITMPLILDSLISFIIFLIYPLIIIKRIKNEEKLLEQELKGYKEYKKKVKYRLIPFIW